MLPLLVKQDLALSKNPNIWFRPFRNFKAFLIKPEQNVNGIKAPKIYNEVISSPYAK
jgi:hypothetical protein